jgi:hypothetical protein
MKGRPEDLERNQAIVQMLNRGCTWNEVIGATGASRSTLARLSKDRKRLTVESGPSNRARRAGNSKRAERSS